MVGGNRQRSANQDEFRRQRNRLVEHLLDNRSARTPAVVAALRRVPRHLFAPRRVTAQDAYADEVMVLTTGPGGFPTSTISQPSIVARMLEQLDVRPGQRVLEIGTASGYNAALLRALTGPQGEVHSVEVDAELAAIAAAALARAGAEVVVHTADGWLGVPDQPPFDRIICTVGVWDLAPTWLDQLVPGGLLVVPLWLRPGLELSVAFQRLGDRLVSRSVVPCAFLRLRGEHAGPESYHSLDQDTFVSGELLDGGRIELLREVWTRPSLREQDLPPAPAGWFARLALADPGAVQLFSVADPANHAVGFFDPEAPGMAIVRGRRLEGYGDPEPALRLRERLAEVTPLNVHRLRVEARRASRDATVPRADWLLDRPEFHFWVRES